MQVVNPAFRKAPIGKKLRFYLNITSVRRRCGLRNPHGGQWCTSESSPEVRYHVGDINTPQSLLCCAGESPVTAILHLGAPTSSFQKADYIIYSALCSIAFANFVGRVGVGGGGSQA